jgi:hypothetical protein
VFGKASQKLLNAKIVERAAEIVGVRCLRVGLQSNGLHSPRAISTSSRSFLAASAPRSSSILGSARPSHETPSLTRLRSTLSIRIIYRGLNRSSRENHGLRRSASSQV